MLRIRLDLLRSSLSTVSEALGDIEKARRVKDVAAKVESSHASLIAAAIVAVDDLRKVKETVPPDVSSELAATANALESARIQAMPSDSLDHGFLSLQHTSVGVDLKADVTERERELERVEVKVAKARATAPDRHQQLLTEAWTDYDQLCRQCEGVFGEYVDLVRGVLLRDAGVDRDLFRIGDQLARSWGRFKDYDWRSVTIPASRERPAMSAARLIRIGFPEWSVWSLALTARELGHVFAAKHGRIQKVVEQHQNGQASAVEIRTWVADMFATGVTGPAYVWAAILLRADPASPKDDERVAVMLRMLELADPGDSHKSERDRLQQAWKAARSRVPSLSKTAESREALVAKVIGDAHGTIPDEFASVDWERAAEVVDMLEDELQSPEQIAAKLQLPNLRHVLSAAWQARLRLADTDGSDELVAEGQQEQLRELAERTRLICVALIDDAGDDTPAPRFRGVRQDPSHDPRSSGGSLPKPPPPPGPGQQL